MAAADPVQLNDQEPATGQFRAEVLDFYRKEGIDADKPDNADSLFDETETEFSQTVAFLDGVPFEKIGSFFDNYMSIRTTKTK